MAPVTVATSKSVAGGSGNTGWSARGTFQRPSSGRYLCLSGDAGFSSFNVGINSSAARQAEAFTVRDAISVTEINLKISKTGTPTDNLTVSIRSDSGTVPGGTVLGTSATIAGSSLTTTSTWTTFTFSSPVALSASTKYWLSVERSGANNGSNYYSVGVANSANAYSGHTAATYDSSSTTWTADSFSRNLMFNINGTWSGGSALYQVTQDTGGSPKLHVYKSTDTGATWTEQDSSNAPTVSNGAYTWSADLSGYGELGIAYFSATNTVRVRVFDVVTDTWAASDVFSANATTDGDNLSNLRVIQRTPANSLVLSTSFADDADLNYSTSIGRTNWSSGSVDPVTSAERSIYSDAVVDTFGPGFVQLFLYDVTDKTIYARSMLDGPTFGTFTAVDSTAAVDETKHASATYQVYDNGSGVAKVVVAYIDSNNTLQERTAQLNVPSPSITFGTQHQVSSSTSYAGRHLSSCKYGSDLYVFASTATGIDYWKDTGATGTWSSVTNWKTGLSSAALSQALSVPGVGILVSYMDGGNVVIDWAVGGPAGASHPLASTAAIGTSTATADKLIVGHPMVSTAAVGTSAAAATRISLNIPLASTDTVGTSSADATRITESHPLASTATVGTSTADATRLIVGHPMVGASTGTSSADALRISESHPLAASSDGTSSTAADLTQGAANHPLEASITGTSSADALRLSLSQPLTATVAGTSTADASKLIVGHPLASTASIGTSTTAATRIIVGHPLTASSTGTSTAGGTRIIESHPLAASSAGTSSTSADLTVSSPASPPAYVSHNVAAGDTVSKPASVAVGDLLLIGVHAIHNADAAVTGFTVLGRHDFLSLGSARLTVLGRIADGSEGSTFTATGGTVVRTACVRLTGVDATIADGTYTDAEGLNGATMTLPATTTTVVNDLLVTFIVAGHASNVTGISQPTGMTERFDTSNTTGSAMSFDSQTIASAGSTGTRSAVATWDAEVGHTYGVMLALKPANTLDRPLDGSSAGTSSASATGLTMDRPLASVAAIGTSTAAATRLGLDQPLAGSSAGTSSAAATQIALAQPLAGAGTGESTAAATTLGLSHPLAGLSFGVSISTAGEISFLPRTAPWAGGQMTIRDRSAVRGSVSARQDVTGTVRQRAGVTMKETP